MIETDYYEIVRQKLSLGPLYAPKHKKVYEMLKIFWNEEEIRILSFFKAADKYNTIDELSKKTGINEVKLTEILKHLHYIGTISIVGSRYGLIPLIPGIYEKYYINQTDTKENQKKVGIIYRWLIDNYFPSVYMETGFKLFRPRLPIDAEEKLIKIEESVEANSQILPYELMSQIIDKYDYFSYIDCHCRLIAKYAGDPCKVATEEMGCLVVGMGEPSPGMKGKPIMNKEEAREYLRKVAKAGLVHSCIPDSSDESTMFICNCCSCHCASLKAVKDHGMGGTMQSNYIPEFDHEICTKCEICLKKCPMEAIFHKLPNELDGSDNCMLVREDICVGCGVCAANCPQGAIKLKKIRDNIPTEKHKIGNKTFLELLS
jgi:Pyruvate/2-oxoacid:ferredoxin oxidoreductase delta subunit